ncbi:protein DpdE [Mesorhizobium sp. M1329]|uniref:protein DpdE n=1 Tax=Mesorhizobium sp. M1329 TaxID=2957083 RepID=UPI003334F84F
MSDSKLSPGMFVSLPGRRGTGRLLAIEGEQCRVALFHSIDEIEECCFDRSDLGRAYLGPQTRVYVQTPKGWAIGRVVDYDPSGMPWVEYTVRFPNNHLGDFKENRLQVRVFEPHADPSDVLARGGGESQFLHDRRWAALESSVALRGASKGLTAFLSSRIELVPHQFAAVRRVLTDFVQRYLLADEVGMGKTIEAGVIARQCLIDDPDRCIRVLAPSPLVSQWRTELEDRCGLGEFPGRVEYLAFSQLDEARLPADLLIVDEAHSLLADETLNRALRRQAHATPRLLLLTATPVLGDPMRLLDLLHLLDPETYGPEDVSKLEMRLQIGRDLGRLLMSLSDDAPVLMVRRAAIEIGSRIPEDELVGGLKDLIVAGGEEATAATADLRQHLADTYRVHQRLVRARRSDAVLYFRPRGQLVDGRREHVLEEVDEDLRWPDILAAIEDWREDVGAELDPNNCTAGRAEAARHLFKQVEAIGFNLDAAAADVTLPAAVAAIAGRYPGTRNAAAVASDSLVTLRRRLHSQGERHPKIVAFASRPETVAAFAFALAERGESALTFTEASTNSDIDAAIARFRTDSNISVLICDRAGEEGLNLNFADALLHLDLPFSVIRMEQRIGRLDRFGRTKPMVRQRILLPSEDDASPWAAWQELLTKGFGIYERSTSDVQFILDGLETEIAQAFLEGGATALREMIEPVRNRLQEARQLADEQYALDAVALADDAGKVIEAIEDAEADEKMLELAAEGWLLKGLQLKRLRLENEEDPFRYDWVKETLLPREPWEREFGLERERPLTWRRRVASRRGAALLRPGARVIDAMERALRWDDRGSAFATWRVDPSLEGSDIAWSGFRLCFVVEAQISKDLEVFRSADVDGLSRRAQSFLSPWTMQFHLDPKGLAAPPHLLDILKRPYVREQASNGTRDINLSSRSDIFARIVEPSVFAAACVEIREHADAILRKQADYLAQTSEAVRLAEQDFRRRARRQDSQGIAEARAVVEAVRAPRVRLDSIGFFVLSSRTPSRAGLA